VAAPSFAYTIARVAEMLGEDEEWLGELAYTLGPENGRLRIYGPGECATLALTERGLECLKELIADEKR
jgi:hypothetical protein